MIRFDMQNDIITIWLWCIVMIAHQILWNRHHFRQHAVALYLTESMRFSHVPSGRHAPGLLIASTFEEKWMPQGWAKELRDDVCVFFCFVFVFLFFCFFLGGNRIQSNIWTLRNRKKSLVNPPIGMNPPFPPPHRRAIFFRARMKVCPNSNQGNRSTLQAKKNTQMKIKDFIGFLLLGGLKSFRGLNSWVGRFFFGSQRRARPW